MPRTELMSFVRCAAVVASPQLGVRRVQLCAGSLLAGEGAPGGRLRLPGRRVAAGGWLDLKGLARLSSEVPLKVRAWTSRGVRKTTQGTLADLLAALNAGPAHLTLRLLSSCEGVRLAWGVQEPDPALHAPGEALPCTSSPPGAVRRARGRALPCTRPAPGGVSKTLGGVLLCTSPPPGVVTKARDGMLPCTSHPPGAGSDALAGAGTAPGGGSTEPYLGDAPRKAGSEAPLAGHDNTPLAAPTAEAQVPSSFLQGGVAPLRTKGRSTGEVSSQRLGSLPVVLWAWAALLLLTWLASLEDEAAVWTQTVLQAVLCLAGTLPAVYRMCTRHPQRLRQEKGAQEGDIDFLGRRIPFLRKEMRALDASSLLGHGDNDCVRHLLYGGAHAVRKEFVREGALLPMMREARLMLELRGAGGVPRPLALGFDPPHHHPGCSVQGMLRSLGLLCRRLGEVHARGVVHNDLKTDNITVSGGVHRSVLHVIDLGWTCRAGRVAGNFTLETGEGAAAVFPSGDVFSLGFLMQDLAGDCVHPWLAVPLWRLGQFCAREDPSCRPSLREVAQAIAALAEELLQFQL
ncbi:hypothetical protein O3P69_002607 [Scylla paramamosain]|uniref:Protein kinase domain-containing protein n=1 Tax=Scylla paramamosain TaxID=85552 RepID=A0AAW0UQM8_SCYPA